MKLLSRKIYKPFNDVVDKAKVSLANESHSDNEIEFLNNLIDDFSQKRIELDSLDKKYAELHLHQTTTKIINGLTNDTLENILYILSHFGIEFSHKIYSLIIFFDHFERIIAVDSFFSDDGYSLICHDPFVPGGIFVNVEYLVSF